MGLLYGINLDLFKDVSQHEGLVGRLIYLIVTRSDIAFVVGIDESVYA